MKYHYHYYHYRIQASTFERDERGVNDKNESVFDFSLIN
jgi:hypothetical protein